MEAVIKIKKHIAEEINAYLREEKEDGDYSSSQQATVFTACFEDGMEADIKMVWDGAYIDSVLFDPNGHEVMVLEPAYEPIEGEYPFIYNGQEYKVEIVVDG